MLDLVTEAALLVTRAAAWAASAIRPFRASRLSFSAMVISPFSSFQRVGLLLPAL